MRLEFATYVCRLATQNDQIINSYSKHESKAKRHNFPSPLEHRFTIHNYSAMQASSFVESLENSEQKSWK